MDDNQNTQINIPSQQNDGFHSKLGFILSAAGAAVGLGSIWRFPYLAAQNGGGLFLIVYIVFAVTIGFSLTKMEIAVGRKTGKNVLDAYGAVNKKFSWVGILGIICPLIVLPYYCVIGGWVTKYMFSYADIINAAQKIGSNPDYFSQFTSGTWQPIVFFAVFTICTAAVIILGVGKGIEKLSIILMPILMVLCLGLAIYVVCQPNALQGLKFYLVPNAKGMSFGDVVSVFSSALSQLFFSLSLAMGVMMTYGSYMKKETSISSSARWIGAFVIFVAFTAGMIIIPSIYAFSSDPDAALSAGGSTLMFEEMPKIFRQIGGVGGGIIGFLFFILVFFAALTSSISIMEVVVDVIKDKLRIKRVYATLITIGIIILLGLPVAFGYSIWSNVRIFGMNFLDFYDYLTANIVMPVLEFILCLMIGWFVNKRFTQDEIGLLPNSFDDKYYTFMIKWVGPIAMLVVLVTGLI